MIIKQPKKRKRTEDKHLCPTGRGERKDDSSTVGDETTSGSVVCGICRDTFNATD
ncbi:MAG: hypothetical protein LBO21_07365 [Synergistaceae bacterium]|jgi:transcription elongation factor Elf1|nr:hypothetical protein [Synergistaceae bacterium]